MNTPWDAPQPPLDYPQSAKVVSLHRGAVVPISLARAARATRDAGMLAALNERAEEAGWDDFITKTGEPRIGTAVDITPYRLTFGERLVLFFRLNGEALTFWFAMGSIGLLVAAVVGAWMGVGR